VAVTDKLKWKKLLNELRYTYDELDLIKEIASTGATDFQSYYEEFCKRHHIDLDELNRKHAEHLEELYGTTLDDTFDASSHYSGSTGIAPYEGVSEDNDMPGENIKIKPKEEDEEEDEVHEIFSKLFKKIALKLHPDKLVSQNLSKEEREEKLAMFKKAKEALDERWYFVLLECAEKYNIPLPKNYKQQTRWMKRELKTTIGRIGKETNTYNYRFADCEDDECKDNLIRDFLNHVFQLNL